MKTTDPATITPHAFADLGELSCGDLLIALMKALKPLALGEILKVRAVDTAAAIDIGAWCAVSGNPLVAGPCGEDRADYYIQKGG